jgi:AcrR family transcriptional regulator
VSSLATAVNQRRLVAVDERIEVDLALGRHLDLVPELSDLVERYPLHDRMWAHLMRARYRGGRHAEALDAYQRARAVVAVGRTTTRASRGSSPRRSRARSGFTQSRETTAVHRPARFATPATLRYGSGGDDFCYSRLLIVQSTGGGMPSRREQAEWRREQLLDAALKVFAGKGVAGASVKDLAAAAGVTSGLLYHYFPSKEAVVVALLRERGFLPRLRALLAGAGRRPAAEVLAHLLAEFDRVLSENAELVTLFFTASPTDPTVGSALRSFVAEGQDLIAGYLRDRVEAGELRPHDARAAGAALFAAVAVGRRTGAGVDPDELARLVLVGLLPRSQPPADGSRTP